MAALAVAETDELLSVVVKRLSVELAANHPAYLLHHVKCVDSRSGEVFEFQMLKPEEAELLLDEVPGDWSYSIPTKDEVHSDWSWQRAYLEWILEHDQTITLKGRQLGVTWVWAGLALWYALFVPGSDVLIYSIKEDDAVQVVGRIWDMWLSLPAHFRSLVKIIKPTRNARPSTLIEFQHPDGRVSSITGMAATKSAGHGRSAALIIFDEASRQDYARDLWKAVVPAAGDKGGKIGVVSTANGMSDPTTKLGNFFHEVWVGSGGSDYSRVEPMFLGWWLHPDRDQRWYENLSLDSASKAEQYPNDPNEAFLMSGSPYFDVESLRWYADNALLEPVFRGEFVGETEGFKARFDKRDGGPVHVFAPPEKGHKYAIFTDCATGGGTDFSVIAVLDLATMAPVAEYHGKGDADRVAEQAHFLGKWYNDARLAVEKQGGYGDTVIAYLRDGKSGRPPYRMLYKHKHLSRPDTVTANVYGFPMGAKERPLVISALNIALREKALPGITKGLLNECYTFVHRDTRPSPRATDGANDDRVIAWGGALELYHQFGEHAQDFRKRRTKPKKPKKQYPWST